MDFTQFSADELKQLDFKWFDDDLICCPAWVVDCLPEGAKMASISGDEMTWKVPENKNDMKDVRFGVTAYGFNKAQLRDTKIKNILEA